jgi:hypothetical protein
MAAGLGYIEFATGDVLTAAAVNGYLASQSVMVFASASARTSAIASPQEGMISYLKDTNATEYYSGSAWVAIGGAASSSGLNLITTQSFSAVSSQSINNCFTSTYDNYVVQVNIDSASVDDYVYVKMRSSGTDASTNYNYTRIAAYATTIFATTTTGATSGVPLGCSAVSGGGATNLYLFNPQKALPTYFDTQGNRKNGTSVEADSYRANHSTASAYDGFSLIPGSGTITGKVKVYGYANS